MNVTRYLCAALLGVSLVLTGFASRGNQVEPRTCLARIDKFVRTLEGPPYPPNLSQVISDFDHYMYAHPQCGSGQAASVHIAALLTSPDDSIRAVAARALGSMGPPARAALPALRRALSEQDAILRSWQDVMLPEVESGRYIREALRRIVGQPVPDFQATGPTYDCHSDIETMVMEVHSEGHGVRRANRAKTLAHYLNLNRECGKTAKIVARIGDLLSDDNDDVRWAAAWALGDIGPFAQAAVPALEAALKRSDAELDAISRSNWPNHYSGQTIREALKLITGRSVSEYQRRRN